MNADAVGEFVYTTLSPFVPIIAVGVSVVALVILLYSLFRKII